MASPSGEAQTVEKGVLTPWPPLRGGSARRRWGRELYGCPKYFGLWQGSLPPPLRGTSLAEGGFSTRWTAHFGGLFFALSNLHIKRMIRLSISPMPQAACAGKTTVHVVNPLFAVHCDIVQTTEKESFLRFLPLKTLKVRTLYETNPTSHRLDVPPSGRYRTRQTGDPAP